MKIGIDARPLKKQRAGIGTYVYNIVKYLNDIDTENEYYLFSTRRLSLISSREITGILWWKISR